ncbi:MAG: hypothetical protein JWN40_6053 [Phycisphaerales bacterium]|nr:hypothetical protein [Phycisphaerales bacterium]
MELGFAMLIIALVVLSVPAIYFLIMSAIADRASGKRKSTGPGGFDVLPPAMSLRYVVLHHTGGVDAPHFDLMFETEPGSPLATWRSPEWPITARTAITRIADHRREYLEYEGPLSDNRGQVHRVAAGHFRFDSRTDERWTLTTQSGLRLTLAHIGDGDAWQAEVST